MLDKERMKSRLGTLAHYKENLERILPKDYAAYRKSAPETKAAVERYLQVISEIEIDVVVQVYKGFELRPAGGEESILAAAEEKLSRRLLDRVRARRNLRNALVHAYSNIEDREVFGFAHDLGDVAEFKKAAEGFLK